MRTAFKAIDPVQHDLATRVGLIGAHAASTSTTVLAAEVDAIRAAAMAHGLYPAVVVTHAIATALARGERGALIQGWITILSDAVSCDRHDGNACETYAAACSARLN